ncbi:TPA: hypothetical protein ACH3X3_15303 [Trebouxia sp. C0006]
MQDDDQVSLCMVALSHVSSIHEVGVLTSGQHAHSIRSTCTAYAQHTHCVYAYVRIHTLSCVPHRQTKTTTNDLPESHMVTITACFTMHAAQTSQDRGDRHVNASALAAETGALQQMAY